MTLKKEKVSKKEPNRLHKFSLLAMKNKKKQYSFFN